MTPRGRKIAVLKFATITSNFFRRHRRSAACTFLITCLAAAPAYAQLFIDDVSRAETVKNANQIKTLTGLVNNIREQLGEVSRRQQALDQQLRELTGQSEEAAARAAKSASISAASEKQAQELSAEILLATEERQKIIDDLATIHLNLSVRIDELKRIVPTPDEDETYAEGVGYFQRENFDEAENKFQILIAYHPEGQFFASAHYWLSQIYFSRNEYEKAAESSLLIIGLAGNNDKKPDAMLTLAQTQVAIGQWEESRNTLENLIIAHPTTLAADKARQILAQ